MRYEEIKVMSLAELVKVSLFYLGVYKRRKLPKGEVFKLEESLPGVDRLLT